MKGRTTMTKKVKIEFNLEYKNNEENHPILKVEMDNVINNNEIKDLYIDFTSDETESLEKLFNEITLLSLKNYSIELNLSIDKTVENEYYEKIAQRFVKQIEEELNRVKENDEYKECRQLMDDYIKFNK